MRYFVYQYNNATAQELEDDPTGALEVPTIGSVVLRKEREWTVIHVVAPVTFNGAIPIVRVFLRENTKPRISNSHAPATLIKTIEAQSG